MSFEKLIHKVTQAENALEARERSLGADWRQLKTSWREAWTPGRIVIAGLVGGFLTGRAAPLGRASGNALSLISALSGVFASGSAQAAAGEAEQVADQVTDQMEQASEAITPGARAARHRAAAEPTAIPESAEP